MIFPLQSQLDKLTGKVGSLSEEAIQRDYEAEAMEQGSTVLPEDCISKIISFTSPRDACKASVVSTVFRSAADFDLVWERFLPTDYRQILSSSVSPFPFVFSSKKKLYLHLCDNPVLIDNGTKTFALEKCSGKKCYMIGAKALSIARGDDPKLWNWKPSPESRFSEVAVLRNILWLEVRGRMETRQLSPSTTYVAYLVLNFTDFVFGFSFSPAEVSVKLAGSGEEVKAVHLNPIGRQRQQFEVYWDLRGGSVLMRQEPMADAADQQPLQDLQVPKERGDGWMEIELGEFFNEKGEDGDVEMSLMEVKGANWKCGLIIQGIELRPKKAK
ncbi:hypothetical protein NE237_014354 [Protea cynaroides]|uniref:F-box domain-containing protein n=1 Tax=Protea cynaroides TaxID=273540 RepID=A0A9Q0KBT5_9MAGN|nr:hypothetical protein NE237_014354 [Protea cynaroides]